LKPLVDAACAKGQSSVFVSGIDPGWALDVLPILLSGTVADIREVRCVTALDLPLVTGARQLR